MRATVIAAVMVLSLGCGDDDDAADAGGQDTGVADPDGGDGGGVSEDIVQFATIGCQRTDQCAPTLLQTLFGGDVDACVAREVETMVPVFALPGVRLEPRACSAMFGGASCGQLLRFTNFQAPPPSGCYLPGTLLAGAACSYPMQCQSFICDRQAGASCGQCADPLELGADCADRHDVFGSPCGAGRTCADGVCVPLGEMGQECDATTAPCFVDLGCVDGVCGPPAQEGDPCTSVLGECDLWSAALVCNPITSLCVAGTFAGVGEACGVQTETPAACAASDCLPDVLDGTCTARAADGEPCDAAAGPHCEPHAQCLDGTCERFFANACE